MESDTMTRRYSLVIEGEPGSYSAYIPELPTILVTGKGLDELASRAAEAIKIYLTTVRENLSPSALMKEIEVEIPA